MFFWMILAVCPALSFLFIVPHMCNCWGLKPLQTLTQSHPETTFFFLLVSALLAHLISELSLLCCRTRLKALWGERKRNWWLYPGLTLKCTFVFNNQHQPSWLHLGEETRGPTQSVTTSSEARCSQMAQWWRKETVRWWTALRDFVSVFFFSFSFCLLVHWWTI